MAGSAAKRMAADRPKLYGRTGSDLSLSGAGSAELLRAVLEKGAACRFRVKGSSMRPFIREGDIVTISPDFRPRRCLGQAVAFVHTVTRKLLIHRVVAKEGCSFVLKGDNCAEADVPVAEESILGRVSRVERSGRWLVLGLGPERHIIAWISRRGRVAAAVRPFVPLLRLTRWRRDVRKP